MSTKKAATSSRKRPTRKATALLWQHYLSEVTPDVPEWVRGVIERTAPRSEAGRNPNSGFYFDWVEADRRVAFIEEYCRYPKGANAGEKMKLDEWQKDRIVRPAFGWKRRGTATATHGDLRRFRRVFVAIPRKNGKSTLIAACALSILLQDGEMRAEIYCLASNTGQASIVKDAIDDFIKMDARLQRMLNVKRGKIEYEGGVKQYDSIVEVLSSGDGKHGKNTHAVLIDELHEFLQPKQLVALEALTSSMLSRTQPLEFTMTTAGSDTNSECFKWWEYCTQVDNGSIEDDYLLPVMYGANPDDDWHDPNVWAKANPGIGSTITVEGFKAEYLKAAKDPRKLNTFLRLHLNIWTHADERWLTDDEWMKCAAKFTEEQVNHLPCYVGIDLAATRDFNAVACLWVDVDKWKFYLKVHHFVNREAAESRDATGGVDYLVFEREGSMTITEGNSTDHPAIRDYVLDFASRNQVKTVAYDRAMSSFIIPQLVDEGIRCEPFSQGIFGMSYPSKQLEVEVMKRNIVHDGSACMRYQMGCVVLYRDNNDNIKPTKVKNSRNKIDGVIASIIAFGQFLHENSEEVNISVQVYGLD